VTPALPRGLSGVDVGRALQRAGTEFVSSRGSHHKYRDTAGHTIAAGTLRSILRQAGWDVETLTKYV
jgi:predicted RNA binding protein YcfA (HicA-like mRNA interferase family)